jgi:hypothetical protein
MLDLAPQPSGCKSADSELLEAWRAVGNARLSEYRKQCWRLALLIRQGVVSKAEAIDVLWEIAFAHSIVFAHGEDRIQAILAESFDSIDFCPMHAEVA